MRRLNLLFYIIFPFSVLSVHAQRAVVTDSLYANGYLITMQPGYGPNTKYWDGGILGGPVKLSIQKDKKKSTIDLNFFGKAEVLATGEGTKVSKQKISFPMDISPGSDYQLMLLTAADSAGNFTLYSGYAFLPEVKKWKLIGTCKVAEYSRYLHPVSTIESYVKNQAGTAVFKETWVMERNGRWKDISGKNATPPEINLANHVDSAARIPVEASIIQKRAATDMKALVAGPEGLYYTIQEKGSGRPVQVSDTVKLYYKGYLLENGQVFDQTKDNNPARFPLSRLIRGWQIGVPLVHVGGKIQLVIPSHLAYGIRTRSPKIPPNGILVFDIEVLETTPAR
jgi:FKBP-type peptidyl-prolyl cis-trans isomerase FkpA